MKVLTHIDLFSDYCRLVKRWGIYLSFSSTPEWEFLEMIKSAPFLSIREHTQALCDGEAFVLCDSEQECQHLYDQVVGDDGPTALNPYSGTARTYALTIGPDGEIRNENT